MVKVGSICLCENSAEDQNKKPVLIGLLSEIRLIGLPSTYTYNIIATFLYLKTRQTYSAKIVMKNNDGKEIINRTIPNIRIAVAGNNDDTGNATMTNRAQNFPFFQSGSYVLTISIQNINDPDDKDEKSLDVPVILAKKKAN